MKILVTGGAGYIGSHVVKALVTLGHKPIVLDNLNKGHSELVSSEVELIVGDIGDRKLVREVLYKNKITTIIHLAALTDVAESVNYPDRYFNNNFNSARILLEEAKRASVTKFIFSSTAAVYGSPEVIPILETNSCSPINPYGQSKLNFEQELLRSGIDSVIFRYFNVAGASEDGTIGEAHHPETHLIPRILIAAKNNNTVFIYGDDYETADGTCVRDYLHVEDIANAHVLALNGSSGIYNLSNAKGFSVKEIISQCEKVIKIPLKVEIKPRRPGDPAILIANCEKANKELGWVPKFEKLEQIIDHAWRWHQSQKYNDLITKTAAK